ncbi:MAG: hypothetical protein C4312_06670, partial [Thermoflexus sp.]
IDELIGWALIDERVRADLLGSRRAEVLARYNLTEEEREWLLQVPAKDLTSFADAVARWLERRVAPSIVCYPSPPFA